MRNIIGILMLSLLLAACGSLDTTQAATNSCCSVTNAKVSWKDRVAVSTNNAAIRKPLGQLIGMNFPVRLVPVPQSHVLVRLLSCSTSTEVALCANVQYAGKIIARKRFADSIHCDDRAAQRILEDKFFQDHGVQDAFLNFVDNSFHKLPKS